MVEKYILKDNISDLFQPKYDNPESYPDQLATEYYKSQEYLESLETYYNIEISTYILYKKNKDLVPIPPLILYMEII